MNGTGRAALWLAALGASLALLAAWCALAALLLGSALQPAQREVLRELFAHHAPLLVLAALIWAGAVAALLLRLHGHWVAPAAQLAERARVLLGSDNARELDVDGPAGLRALVQVLNQLARQRRQLQHDIDRQVAEASRDIARERDRLAALMSELTQSVVVCNLDGRVLLYNSRARVQFRALSLAPSLADGAELLGLGRSIYAVFDRRLVVHALESVQQRLARGVPHPQAQFVTITRAGQLLRVQLAPVRASAADDGALSGFVLMLDNITREFEQDNARDRLLHGLTQACRGALAKLHAALQRLDEPVPDAAARASSMQVLREQSGSLAAHIDELSERGAIGRVTRWPLEDTLGADLVGAAQRRIEQQLQLRVAADAVDAELWLRLDSYSLLQALLWLAARLREAVDPGSLQLRLARADATHAHLDLAWRGGAIGNETAMAWQSEAMDAGAEGQGLSVRDVVQRHGGEFWFERERVGHEAFFRFRLPLAPESDRLDNDAFVQGDSRPEFYDFDLFARGTHDGALDQRLLVELSYTVFDTETTGLEPSAGDRIIQIGAVRVVNGRLLRGEAFEQLVDPQRPLPAAGIAIHGIRPEMLAGQPTLAAVLPSFHAYAHDTVLVAHNAAFDMRFLELAEDACGVRFDQPVLDTLLLSVLAQPTQPSHRLEAIAERLGVQVIGRHTAIGDALVTAEVLVKLLPLLAQVGIHTLGQARAAAQKVYYARSQY